jgi:putative two-component system hydrogenase maturation factor HypX/HoxX
VKILLLCHSFNSLAQKAFVELKRNHQVTVEFDINDAATKQAVELFKPHLIIAPYLKRLVSQSIWQKIPTLIIHPGIPGDKGPSSLDWAIMNEEKSWGVTVFQANEQYDAGDIWDFETFDLPPGLKKSTLYRTHITQAAMRCLLRAIRSFERKEIVPLAQKDYQGKVKGIYRPLMSQKQRFINWKEDSTRVILKKINAADSRPGVLDHLQGVDIYLYNAIQEHNLKGRPKEILATRNEAICLATKDGALWITHMKGRQKKALKLPATKVIQVPKSVPEIPAPWEKSSTYQDIYYEQKADVGYLYFEFYNGAIDTKQCKRLKEHYNQALQLRPKVLVLMGGTDFWSNGINLNLIENSHSPAEESWKNIRALNKLIRLIIETKQCLVISVLRSNAGAGGIPLALAADYVWAFEEIVLNPHYKEMGNLYGSEYWSYLMPRRVGKQKALEITNNKLPMDTEKALKLELIDR